MSLPRSGLTTRRRILRGCGLVQWTMALAAPSLVVETGFRDLGMSPLWWGRSWTWWKRFSGTRGIKSASPLRAASAPQGESLRGEDCLLCRGLLMGTGGGWPWAFKHFPSSRRVDVPAPLSPASGPDCWFRIGAQQQFRVRTILESVGRTLGSVPTGSSVVLLDDPNALVGCSLL